MSVIFEIFYQNTLNIRDIFVSLHPRISKENKKYEDNPY